MTLAAEIQAHADRANADLEEVHNFYDHTKGVWRIFQLSVAEGRKHTFTNMATNTKVDQDHVLGLAQHYATEYLASSVFQRCVTIFENFTFDFLRSFLTKYPQRLSEKEIKVHAVVAAADLASLIAKVIDHEINQLKYERPADWFSYFETTIKLGCPGAGEIARIAEMKASRDILEHNRGVVNSIYVNKAGAAARFKDGDKIEIPDAYQRASWELLKKVIGDMAVAGVAKFK